eukprot:CAMPEP_0194756886 /NCGR_PEP_ID=MMETSP0323_2-20130528/10505_1 /TAXON_ID=2866 ORGANISM="Crypthecodinium cohnii, Strain Seligo" /NCGR_SAMPLE_ID=MMETSP0323_2 /ASSEMBLY_ACC=CAM_ASM_000346 /LENGTH=133 /DNA_ID=CAMNT_0039676595 /DNA_START=247 /DNA_END=646 /DNA_ORIENTATION=+
MVVSSLLSSSSPSVDEKVDVLDDDADDEAEAEGDVSNCRFAVSCLERVGLQQGQSSFESSAKAPLSPCRLVTNVYWKNMEGMEDKAKITNITTVNWGIQTQKEFKLSVNSGFEPLLQQIDVLSPSLFATRMYC